MTHQWPELDRLELLARANTLKAGPQAAMDLMRRAGMEPDPWQAEVLCSDWQRALLLCSRQSGKSTVTAAIAVYEAVYHPPALVLLLAPSLRQSQELFGAVTKFYASLDKPVPAEAASALRLRLANGSRIIALPGKEATVRGFSGVTLLVIDEAARVPDELYASVRPMLAVSKGRLIALSTPFGTRGWFYEAWRSDEAWQRHKVTAAQCPRISPEFLAEERRTLGHWWYAQEYDVEFMDAISAAFRREDIDNMFKQEILTWQL